MKFSGKVRSDRGTTWFNFGSNRRNRCATRGWGLLCFRTTACLNWTDGPASVDSRWHAERRGSCYIWCIIAADWWTVFRAAYHIQMRVWAAAAVRRRRFCWSVWRCSKQRRRAWYWRMRDSVSSMRNVWMISRHKSFRLLWLRGYKWHIIDIAHILTYWFCIYILSLYCYDYLWFLFSQPTVS